MSETMIVEWLIHQKFIEAVGVGTQNGFRVRPKFGPDSWSKDQSTADLGQKT